MMKPAMTDQTMAKDAALTVNQSCLHGHAFKFQMEQTRNLNVQKFVETAFWLVLKPVMTI